MKQFRYVIKGIDCEWQNCEDVSIAKMNYVAERLSNDFGKDWYVEYRG